MCFSISNSLERTANTLIQILSNNSLKREFKDYLWSINLRFFDEIRKETKEIGDDADIVSQLFF